MSVLAPVVFSDNPKIRFQIHIILSAVAYPPTRLGGIHGRRLYSKTNIRYWL